MEAIGTIQGLASGIDFRELVDAIIEAESRPVLLLSDRKADIQRRSTAWGDVQLRVQSAFDRARDLADSDFFRTYQASVLGDEGTLTVSAGPEAVPGTFDVEVLQLATREKVGSDVFDSRTDALGLEGEFVVGGRAVQVGLADSLDDVAGSINATAGSSSGGASASVVNASGGGYRIVLTASASGAAGVGLADGANGVLASMGFVDAATGVKSLTSNGAMSDGFSSASASIGSLLGLTGAPAAASVTIGALSVEIDLANDSLDDIAAAINTAASGAGSSISAQVVSETSSDGSTVRRLDIDGATSFTDSGSILQTLGVLEATRTSVAQQVQGMGFTDGDASTAASATTLLSDLWVGGVNAGIQVGDTLSIEGTHGDGATFTKTVSVAGGDTLQDLLDELNSASDGFGVGSRTATASVVDGALTVTDDVAGTSRLGLSIVSHNEGGGTLDFGDFGTLTAGRDREITGGVDAELLVDGAFNTRSSNAVTDVVDGVTLNLAAVSSGGASTVEVSRDVDAVVSGIEAFVQAYNAVSEYVLGQFTGAGAEEGQQARPLSGDSIARTVRDQMRAVLQSALPAGAGTFAGLADLGIEANRTGTYDIDTSKLREALESDPLAVQRIFSAYGEGSTSALQYVSAGTDAEGGTYDVLVTTAAERGSVLGTGFAGTYVDDGNADLLTITDASTESSYALALSNGMTLAEIVDALNAAFETATTRELVASNGLYADAVGTSATDGTVLAELHDAGGSNLGVATGDTFTISGTRDDGSSFFEQWTVANAATQTLGSLQAEISDAIGAAVVVDVVDGALTVTATEEGRRSFEVAVSSNNLGGGTFSLGTMDVVEEGRSTASITASDTDGQLAVSHDDYGSVDGFTVAFTAGGTDGTASLGVGAGTYMGVDVAGTIGGEAATGLGLLLTGDEGSGVEGLTVRYSGTEVGQVGNVTYSQGFASRMESITDGYLDGGSTSIQGIVERLDTQVRGIDDRIQSWEERLERRAEALIRRFAALEEALARAQQESAWLIAQIGSLSDV